MGVHINEAGTDHRVGHIENPTCFYPRGVTLDDCDYVSGDSQAGPEPSLAGAVYDPAVSK